MRIDNTQANIFKVNGGIADNFANRPAAQGSFYIFYSIDTQEIYYDNGAWVLIGSGGGGVNIYNSDGTLTSDRILSGVNFGLTFQNLNFFNVRTGSFGRLFISGNSQARMEVQNMRFAMNYSPTQPTIETFYNNNREGLLINFFAKQINLRGNDNAGNRLIELNVNYGTLFYGFNITQGNQLQGIDLNFNTQRYTFGRITGGNQTLLFVDGQNDIIKTTNQGNDIGLKLDFANSFYQFGQITGNNNTFLQIDDINEILEFFNRGNANGIQFLYNQSLYRYGQITGGNGINIEIDDTNNILSTYYNGTFGKGLVFNYATQRYFFGVTTGGPNTYIEVDNSTSVFRSIFQSATNGVLLTFSNNTYQFGQITGGNQTLLFVDGQNDIIKTTNQNNDIGLKLDFANNYYFIGEPFFNNSTFIELSGQNKYIGIYAGEQGTGNGTSIILDDIQSIIKTKYQFVDNGLKLDFANSIYEFGQLTGGNLTYIKIDDSGLDDIIINGKNIFIGDKFVSQNGTVLIIDDNNETISTFFQGGNYGIALEYFHTRYKFGQLTGGNTTYLEIDDINNSAKFFNAGSEIGLGLDYANRNFGFGDYAGNFNQSNLTIDDLAGTVTMLGNNGTQNISLNLDSNATYPIIIGGTNVLSNTSGSTSGQHLKIKINGVDYKIELKNP